VSGSGKTTLARALAETLSLPFIDADDLHSQTNKDKMARGEPLTDADRMPWLVKVRRAAVEAVESKPRGEKSAVVVACSALKASYRDVLRGKQADLGAQQDGEQAGNVTLALQASARTYFVHPIGSRSILWERLTVRKSHFMKANMLVSQLDTLENPGEIGEEGIVEVRLDAMPEEQVKDAIEGLRIVGAVSSAPHGSCLGSDAGVTPDF
jgi:gluconokinase